MYTKYLNGSFTKNSKIRIQSTLYLLQKKFDLTQIILIYILDHTCTKSYDLQAYRPHKLETLQVIYLIKLILAASKQEMCSSHFGFDEFLNMLVYLKLSNLHLKLQPFISFIITFPPFQTHLYEVYKYVALEVGDVKRT